MGFFEDDRIRTKNLKFLIQRAEVIIDGYGDMTVQNKIRHVEWLKNKTLESGQYYTETDIEVLNVAIKLLMNR